MVQIGHSYVHLWLNSRLGTDQGRIGARYKVGPLPPKKKVTYIFYVVIHKLLYENLVVNQNFSD